MAEILVTGGAGFIGSAIIKSLNELGRDDIIVCDYLGHDEKYRNLVPLRFEDYLEGDALLAGLYNEDSRLDDIRYVFHLGANSSTQETNVRQLIENNYEFSKRLGLWAIEQDARFIYASSAATYGDGINGMDDKMEDISRLRPLNAYGYSKHLFDLYALRQGWLSSFVGLKYFNVFGPNEYHKGEMRSLVHKAYQAIKQTGRMGLFKSYREGFADGEQCRDFLYVKDAVAMTLHLAFSESAAGLYNLGSGVARTWLSLANALFKAMGLEPQIDFIEMPEKMRDAYQYYTCADISKLVSTGYCHPVTCLEDAITDYVQQYLIPGRRLGE